MLIGKYIPSKAIQKSKRGGGLGDGYLTIVNSAKNGKRLEFRKEIAEKLSLTDFLTVVYTEESAVFFRANTETEGVFHIKKNGERLVVYSGALVAELSEFLNLNFASGVCHTFTEGRFEEIEEFGVEALVITKKSAQNIESEDTENEHK